MAILSKQRQNGKVMRYDLQEIDCVGFDWRNIILALRYRGVCIN